MKNEKKKLKFNEMIVFIAFIALFVIFSITLRNVGLGFAHIDNLMNILRQTCLIAIMAVGMTYVLGAALIDLSTGPVVACSSPVSYTHLDVYKRQDGDTGTGAYRGGAWCVQAGKKRPFPHHGQACNHVRLPQSHRL